MTPITRSYIISALADLPDTDAVAKRLPRKQDDTADAIKPVLRRRSW